MATTRLSRHIVEERAERMELLNEYFGYSTKVLLETYNENKDARIRIYSSGICQILDLYEDFVITAYALTVTKASAIYHHSCQKNIPPKLHKRIIKNMERHPEFYMN